MATGLIAAVANGLLEGTADLSEFTWVKLHVGDPGADGTSNPATETTRKQVTWSAASSGQQVSTNDLVWTSIAASGTEDATHFSVLDQESGGNVGFTGTVTANPYNAGDTLTIPAGSLTRSFTVAS
ncbi:hypothetical protein SAMN05443637_1285 [Pseudonocardia thermophila]|uniref:Uncharacterized protein n=1 Tax=Pseudonocardia thermophila TaxID=1848 RepID=A0A1M7AI05_PSETH|nr:hypothetical protein [Pseudonocardia thermophila]SHL42119.1 hypothetical protein SAMN05443637_1285 [Pseudonocardia thermophila]